MRVSPQTISLFPSLSLSLSLTVRVVTFTRTQTRAVNGCACIFMCIYVCIVRRPFCIEIEPIESRILHANV